MMATAHAKEILEEINKLRANPAAYADRVQEYISYFTDKTMKIPGINVQVRTQEGDAPYKETVEFLKAQEPVNPMTPSKGLCQIAQEILDKVVDSETGEIEEDETERIIDSHGTFSGKFTRAMDFGGFTSEQIVINFLVCDGDPERTQREPLLGKGLQKVGVAYGKHNIYSTICVLVSCTEFTNTKENDIHSKNKPNFKIIEKSEIISNGSYSNSKSTKIVYESITDDNNLRIIMNNDEIIFFVVLGLPSFNYIKTYKYKRMISSNN